MRKTIVLLMLLPAVVMGQLQGDYSGSYESVSTKTKEQLWESTLDCITKGNFTIKSTDKESGIITVVSPDLYPSYSYEKKGELKDTSAYVALDKIRALDPRGIKLTMNIRVTENKVICSTTSVDVTTDKSNRYKWRVYPGAKSTGKYEKFIVESII